MSKRLVWAATAAVLAGCGGDRGATAEANRGEAEEPAREGRFEVSVDTQRVATPDSEVAPSENPDH
jgi:hypothetical protein